MIRGCLCSAMPHQKVEGREDLSEPGGKMSGLARKLRGPVTMAAVLTYGRTTFKQNLLVALTQAVSYQLNSKVKHRMLRRNRERHHI